MSDILTGATKVSDINQQQLRLAMEEMTAMLDPNQHLLNKIMGQIGPVKSYGRRKVEWRERRLLPCSTTVTAAAAVADTTVSVATPKIGARDQVVYAPRTNSVFVMNEDVGGTSAAGKITVRGKAGSGGIPVALEVGDVLNFLLEVHAEGEDIPPAYANTEDAFFTYIQQFDATIKVTDITRFEDGYGTPDELGKQRKQKYIELIRAFCLAMYGSQSFLETVSGTANARRYGMASLPEYLRASARDLSVLPPGSLSLAVFADIIRTTKFHSASSAKKIAIAGQNAIVSISALPANAVRTTPGAQSQWGTTVQSILTAFGEVDIMHDQLLSQEYGQADRMYILDPNAEYLHLTQLNNLPWQILTNRQNPTDVHNVIDIHTGTRGFILKLPELHKEVIGIN